MAATTHKQSFFPGSASSSLKSDCFGAPANRRFREVGCGASGLTARRMDALPGLGRGKLGDDRSRLVDRAARFAKGVGARLTRLASCSADALARQRRRQVDREIARLLARSGGRLTDSMEREIMRKVFASDWSLPE